MTDEIALSYLQQLSFSRTGKKGPVGTVRATATDNLNTFNKGKVSSPVNANML